MTKSTTIELLTATGEERVVIKMPNGTTCPFASMQEAAEASDSLQSLVGAWRGSEEQKKLEGLRKSVYSLIVEGMKREIAAVNPDAANHFPDQVFFGSTWVVDAKETDEGIKMSTETNARSVILLVTQILASVQTSTLSLSNDEWARLSGTLEDVIKFCDGDKIKDGIDEWTANALKLARHWQRLSGAFAAGYDPRQAPKSNKPQVDVEELVDKL